MEGAHAIDEAEMRRASHAERRGDVGGIASHRRLRGFQPKRHAIE